MKIKIQVTGGVGNQLFIWSGAHYLQELFKTPVELFFIDDKNSRSDRKLELEKIAKYCDHSISIRSSKSIGILYRILDRFQLEKNQNAKKVLQSFGIYSFDNPVSEIFFEHAKPRLIRSYFQRTNLVDLTWESWANEFTKMLDAINVAEITTESNYNAIHIRRGDTSSLTSTHGVLSESYFEKTLDSSNVTYICTDESKIPKSYLEIIDPAEVYTPKELDALQTMKLFSEAHSFTGVNSTLSWWVSYIRIKNGKLNTFLPNPWTRVASGYEDALHIDGVKYLNARFINAE
jgi:hypothetical protein